MKIDSRIIAGIGLLFLFFGLFLPLTTLPNEYIGDKIEVSPGLFYHINSNNLISLTDGIFLILILFFSLLIIIKGSRYWLLIVTGAICIILLLDTYVKFENSNNITQMILKIPIEFYYPTWITLSMGTIFLIVSGIIGFIPTSRATKQ